MSLNVETGTASSTSDSYISVADADIYIDTYTEYTSWATLATVVKERWLRRATQRLDSSYSYFWKSGSSKVSEDQALQWPRYGATDSEGFSIDSNVVPTTVKRAVAELAGIFSEEGDTLATIATTGIAEEEVKLGDLEERIKYAGSKEVNELAPRIIEVLSGYFGKSVHGEVKLKRC